MQGKQEESVTLKTLGSDAAVNDVLAELELTGAVIVRDLID